MPYSSGENHIKAIHSDDFVAKIRKEHMAYINGRCYQELGKKYGISMWTIIDWVTYRTRRSARDD